MSRPAAFSAILLLGLCACATAPPLPPACPVDAARRPVNTGAAVAAEATPRRLVPAGPES
jgi:hypothetical protein